mgnify:CR=1 FL=1
MFKELDPLLHSQLRLAVMSILLSVEEAEFVYIKEKTNATAGISASSWTNLMKLVISRSRRGLPGRSPERFAGSQTKDAWRWRSM